MQGSVAHFLVIANRILSLGPYADYSSRSVCVVVERRRRKSCQSEIRRRTVDGAVVRMDVIGWCSRMTSEDARAAVTSEDARASVIGCYCARVTLVEVSTGQG